MKKRWNIKKHDHNAAKQLADILNVKPLIAALLIDRGYSDVESAKRFLHPDISHMHSHTLLKDIKAASERIIAAISTREKILIWGDYDVDGTTGTALLMRTLKHLGADSEFHIPNRFTEGYGVNIPGLEKFKDRGGKVVITVDCGIRSFDAADWLRENGLDMIITDHHIPDPGKALPDAAAVVNPNRPDCNYPDKTLAGVGVALKLALQLLEDSNISDQTLTDSFYEIAAIGTIADVMDLGGENRAIVDHGIKKLKLTNNQGLRAMMEMADCRSDMTSHEIAYRIAPRINAAGRMDAAGQIVEILECNDFSKARKIAENLNKLNSDRQKMQQTITDAAIAESDVYKNKSFIVVTGEGWHRGVIGLAASRLAEKFHRPVIVLSEENGLAHGSGRSIPGFDILKALESCSDYMEQFGGHSAAAGMTVKKENIAILRKMLEQYADSIMNEDLLLPTLEIDARLTSSSIVIDIIEQLKSLEPFGQGNKKPMFVTDGLYLRFAPTVMKDKHLKLYLGDNNGERFEAVWWNGVEQTLGQTPRQGDSIEVAYRLEVNNWQGNRKIQLVVEGIRPDNSSR